MKRILLITVGALLAITLITTLLAGHYRHELYQAGIQSEAAAIGLQSNHVQLGDITWTYWENGLRGQKPTLVLVHGFGASRETWLPMSKHLAQDFHLVIPDDNIRRTLNGGALEPWKVFTFSTNVPLFFPVSLFPPL